MKRRCFMLKGWIVLLLLCSCYSLVVFMLMDGGWQFLLQIMVQVHAVHWFRILIFGTLKTMPITTDGLIQFQEVIMEWIFDNIFAQEMLIQCLLEVIVSIKTDKIVILQNWQLRKIQFLIFFLQSNSSILPFWLYWRDQNSMWWWWWD